MTPAFLSSNGDEKKTGAAMKLKNKQLGSSFNAFMAEQLEDRALARAYLREMMLGKHWALRFDQAVLDVAKAVRRRQRKEKK